MSGKGKKALGEKLRDPLFLPILKDIISAHQGDEEVREAAYFIMARPLIHAPDAAMISFHIDRIKEEADDSVKFRMLTHLACVTISASQPMEAVFDLTRHANAQIRCAAIGVLGCQDSPRCRQALRAVVSREDHNLSK